jgi:hypothetical protein
MYCVLKQAAGSTRILVYMRLHGITSLNLSVTAVEKDHTTSGGGSDL